MKRETKILIITLMISLVACSQDKKPKIYSSNNQMVSNKYNPFEALLIGQWTMCAEGTEDGLIIHYNVCPKIEFNANGTLDVITGEIRTQKWTVKNDTLYIALNPDTTSNWFTGRKYLLVKSEDANSIEVKLKQPETKGIYYLSKEKTKLNIGLGQKAN